MVNMVDNKAKELVEIKRKLKEGLIKDLSLEDMSPEDIKDNEALFVEGLELDSLDSLEIVVMLQRDFGLELEDTNKIEEIFYSVDTLSKYIYEHTKLNNSK